ncbi:MAG: hypothetical protein ACI8U0_000503 [Flavobacteriales bacterium]|jgi:hypothetical protein
MKKISFIISMLAISILSINAQECNNYYETEGTDNDPGIYGGGDFSIDYDGTNQEVELGIYGFFEGWSNDSQANQTFFSVNGSEPIAVSELTDFLTFINGVYVSLNTTSINDEYLPNASSIWTSGTVKFTGAINNITMTQFESGLLFSCVDSLEEITGHDYQFEGDDPGFPGYIITNAYRFAFSGEEIEVSIGYFDYISFEDQVTDMSVDQSFFSVNGSEMIGLGTIYENQPYMIGGVAITIDTTAIPASYNVPDNMISGTIIFEGEIDLIITHQVESGIKFLCVEGQGLLIDCEDYTEDNNDPNFPGIYGGSDVVIPFDGSYQTVAMGVYGLFDNWSTSGQQNQTIFTFENGQSLSLKYIQQNVPMLLGDLFIDMDLTSLNDEYLSQSSFDWTSATISFTGAIEEIIMTQFESGLLFSCTEPTFLDDCINYTEWNSDPSLPGIWLLWDDYTLNYDGTYQEVSLGVYGVFADWIADAQGGLLPYASININGDYVTLETIVLNSPYTFNDVVIELDTNAIPGDYLYWEGTNTGTVTLTGNISNITLNQMEWGLLSSCTMPIVEEESDCNDYTEDNNDPNAPGIYLDEGEYQMDFDSTHKEISIGVYGFFNWDDISSVWGNQTFFSVNGGDAVSLETIYLNQPYVIDDIELTVDTNALNSEYPLADYWFSGTVIFTGHVSQIVMSQFVSGLLFSCAIPSEDQCDCDECACQIDADFSYVNIGSYYSFVSSGTGTEYSWDFGDGNSSIEENPTHQFSFPNAYNVCMTNFNLTDNCSITICKPIEFMANTPESNIITPNNDGYDDQVKLSCGNVTVYDRNGIVVTELISQEYWQGTDGNGLTLPMGEYILRCKETEVIRKITVIR